MTNMNMTAPNCDQPEPAFYSRWGDKYPWILLLIGIGLSLPIVILYWTHYNMPLEPQMAPTGFIHSDIPYYIAIARQYSDGVANGIFYPNPYDIALDSPRVYFQPLFYLWGLILSISPIDPGLLLTFSTIITTVLAFMLLGHLYFTYALRLQHNFHFFCLIFLAWGGGALALLGAGYSLFSGLPLDFFHFDSEKGWWFLNLGRNFSYPTEAFYHLITILIYFCALTNRRRALLMLVFLMAISHPFTGVQYALIVFAWLLTERYIFKQKGISLWNHLTGLFIVTGTLIYYLWFLPSFDAHRSLMQQWSLDWHLEIATILGAYGIVALFALSRCMQANGFKLILGVPFNRFLLVCFIVSFGLANHELFIPPKQPVHFTRGHIWLPLCLLALPAISRALFNLRKKMGKPVGTGLIIVACLLLLSDNISFYYHCYTNRTGLSIQKSHKAALEFIAGNLNPPTSLIFISNDLYLSFLSATYLPVLPLVGHWPTTPYQHLRLRQAKEIIKEGKIAPELGNRSFLFAITPNNAGFPLRSQSRLVMQNQDPSLFLYPRRALTHRP